MFKKKLMGIAMILMLMLMTVSVCAEGSDNGEYIKEYEVLKSIGITIDDFDNDREITRSETAKVVCEIGGYLPQSGETGFFDVPQKHSYAGYISAACKAGVMTGYGDGVFEPNRAITYSELAKTILDMMGYGKYAGISGGYPEGYLRYASSLSFGKGTGGVSSDAPLNGENFAKIIYNALDKEVLQLELNGSGTKYITEDGETFAYRYMKVKKGEGRVVATDSAAIIGQTLGKDTVKINDEILIDKNGKAKLLLGYETEFWVREIDKDDMPELLFITPDDDQKTLDLRSYDIIDVNTSRLTYYENNKEKHINLADDLVCIYNGDVIAYTPDDLKPYDGTVKVIINSDNRAAVAVVCNYTYGVVKGISSVGNKIVFDDGQNLSLDAYREWKLIKNGKEIEFIELVAGNVLNIMSSKDGTKLCIEVIGGKVSGRITGINNDADRTTVYLDTIPDGIIVSPYYNAPDEIRLSYQGEWYTNILGDIFYSAAVKSGIMQYGYMASYSLLDEDKEAVMFKIFTSDGSFIKPYTRNKVILVEPDGKNNVKLAYDKFGEYLRTNNTQPQLIKYMLDDEGYLQKVQFSELNYNKTNGENIKTVGSYPVGAFTCDYIADGDTTGYFYIFTLDCKFFIGSDAVIFKVPEDKKEEKGYEVINSSDIVRKKRYAMDLYDVKDDYEAKACVINLEGESSDFNWGQTELAIIDKSNFEYLESESDEALALSVYKGGKEAKLYCMDSDMVTQKTVQGRYEDVRAWDLKEGDVIACIADSEGIMKKFELMYSPSREEGSYFMYSDEAGMPNKLDYKSDLYFARGIVKVASNNGLVINAKGDGSDDSWNHFLCYSSGSTRVYLFNSNKKTWKSVAFSSLKKDDIVVIRMLGYTLCDVLIYE